MTDKTEKILKPRPGFLMVPDGAEDRKIDIGVNIMAPSVVDQLIQLQRKNVDARLEDLEKLKTLLPPPLYQKQAEQVLIDKNEVDDESSLAAWKAAHRMEGLIVILVHASPQISTEEEAKSVLSKLTSYSDLIDELAAIQFSVEAASKNSRRLGLDEDENENQASPEKTPTLSS